MFQRLLEDIVEALGVMRLLGACGPGVICPLPPLCGPAAVKIGKSTYVMQTTIFLELSGAKRNVPVS